MGTPTLPPEQEVTGSNPVGLAGKPLPRLAFTRRAFSF